MAIAHQRRHRLLYALLRLPLGLYGRLRFGFHAQPVPDVSGPCLILANHNADFDPFLLSIPFRQQMYFVASEHIFRWGVFSRFIHWVVAPIARRKGMTDATAALQILKILKQGGHVCLFAEGDRSFNGRTGPIHKTVGRLAQRSGATVITYRLSGAYLSTPRWSTHHRRGSTSGKLVGIYPPQALAEMTEQQVSERVAQDLLEDAFATQLAFPARYRGKKLAEQLETALFLCPRCGKGATLHSADDRFFCSCGLSLRYTEFGFFSGDQVPFRTVAAWDDWQLAQLPAFLAIQGETPFFRDEGQTLRKLEQKEHRAQTVAAGAVQMSRSTFQVGECVFPLEKITQMAIYGRANLVFSSEGENYELRFRGAVSARKYLLAYQSLIAAAPQQTGGK